MLPSFVNPYLPYYHIVYRQQKTLGTKSTQLPAAGRRTTVAWIVGGRTTIISSGISTKFGTPSGTCAGSKFVWSTAVGMRAQPSENSCRQVVVPPHHGHDDRSVAAREARAEAGELDHAGDGGGWGLRRQGEGLVVAQQRRGPARRAGADAVRLLRSNARFLATSKVTSVSPPTKASVGRTGVWKQAVPESGM